MKSFTFSYTDGKVHFSSEEQFDPNDFGKLLSIVGSYVRHKVRPPKQTKIPSSLSSEEANSLLEALQQQFPRESFKVVEGKLMVLCHEDKVFKDLFAIHESDCSSCREKAILARASRILSS